MVLRSITALSSIALSVANANMFTKQGSMDELCSLKPGSYAAAKNDHKQLAFAIEEVEKHSIATWYSDRNAGFADVPSKLVSTCPESSRLSVVVYGLPKKDCEAGYSTSGSTVQNTNDYVAFLNNLIGTINNRKVLYVLEPDAVGLLAKDGGCGEEAGYRTNLKIAIDMLSANPNAEIYLDVGYWTLAYPEPRQRVVEVVKDLTKNGGRVKGITLNTSNYRKNEEMAELCSQFQSAMGDATQMNCIVDTSRNYRGSPSTEWCNVAAAGIGRPPTANTGFSNIDYFLWIKPPGESDGQCNGSGHTEDAMRGPDPGGFFVDGFRKLWDQGYFVDALNMPKSDGSNSPIQNTPSATPEPTTTTPTSSAPTSPEPTTATPTSSEPATTTPTSSEPITTTPTSSEPITTTPTSSEPITTTPTSSEPSTTTPTSSEPITTTPTSSEPSTTTPTSSEPITTTPISSAPTIPEPTTTPAPTTAVTPIGGGDGASPSSTPVVSSDATTAPTTKPTKTPSTKPPRTPKPTTKKPRTPKPTTATPTPTTTTPSSSSDAVQNDSPSPDGGPSTIGSAPPQAQTANTKSGETGSSATGGIIAAVLVGAVALAVAAAVFIHIRRRAQEATADDMKTPVTMDPAHPAYLSQL